MSEPEPVIVTIACPFCGALVVGKSGQTCRSCGTTLPFNYSDGLERERKPGGTISIAGAVQNMHATYHGRNRWS